MSETNKVHFVISKRMLFIFAERKDKKCWR